MKDTNFTILWWFLPYIDMNQPRCPSILTTLPPPFPPHRSGSPQNTGFECPASCMELTLVIYFTYGNIHVSMLFSQIIPPSPSPTKSKSLSFTSGLLCCPACRIISTVFLNSIYMLIYSICLSLSDLLHSVQ